MAQTDTSNLDLLATLHYVLAGIMGFFALMPIGHIAIGLAMVSNANGVPLPADGTAGPPAVFPMEFGWFFVIIGGMSMLMGLLMTGAAFLAARNLKRRRNLLLCQVFAGLECMMFPLGTALGVFSLITLSKPEVKELFRTEEVVPAGS